MAPGRRQMPSRHGVGADALYEPLDPGSMCLAEPGSRWAKLRHLCVNTRGRAFNLLVAVVICANALCIALESDLGLLSTSTPGWSGLHQDLGLLGVDRHSEQELQKGLEKGLEADAGLKAGIEKEVKDRTQYDINLQKELNLKKGPVSLKSAAYTTMEFFFAAFFTVEFLLRLCQFGTRDFCKDLWNLYDFLLVIAGIADVALPFVLSPKNATDTSMTWLSALRMTRVLRVVRLFRVCEQLRILGWGFASAFATVLRTGLLTFIVNFVLASLLTTLIGQRAYIWGEQQAQVHMWFGSVGRSLRTLCSIMTLSGWDDVAVVLSAELPGFLVGLAIVLYILLCFFAMLCLAAGLVNATLASVQRDDELRKAHATEDLRTHFADVLTSVLTDCDESKSGSMDREDFKAALEKHPVILARLKRLEVEMSVEDLLQHFDRLSQDTGSDSKAVKVDALVESVVHFNCNASSAEVFDVKYALMAMRQELGGQLAAVQQEVMGQQRQLHTQLQEQVAGVGREITSALQSMGALQQHVLATGKDVQAVSQKLEQISQQRVLDKVDQNTSSSALQQKFDALSCQMAESRSRSMAVSERLEALATQVSSQGTFNERLEYLSTQFTAQFAAQFATQFATLGSKLLPASPQPTRGGCKGALEPESTNLSEENAAAANTNFANFSLASWPDSGSEGLCASKGQGESEPQLLQGFSPSAWTEPESTVRSVDTVRGAELVIVAGSSGPETTRVLNLDDVASTTGM